MRTASLLAFVVLSYLLEYTEANKTIIVPTNYGDVLGVETNMAQIFYGIPFAQPPLDELRWNNPVPVSKWAPKTLNATTRAPACPQPPCDGLPSILCPPIFSEDCLYLNIFKPLQTNLSSASPLSVMVFIPGGNFQFLDASVSIYEAEHFVNTTNIILVLIQYRLGALGFLATGTGPNDIKGNYGILDQRLAIAWVKENIAAFNGDPNQITLFGQSAGAQSAALHHVTSEMQSYIQGTIVQSAPMTIPFRTYPEYVVPAGLFAEELKCTIGDISCLRRQSYQNITVAQAIVNTKLTSFNFLLFFEPWVPVIDYNIVHGQLTQLVKNTSFPLKPLIIGTLTEEAVLYIYGAWAKPVTLEQYIEVLLFTFHEKGYKVLEEYPPTGLDDLRPLMSRIATDWVFACSTRVYARKAASYSYVFGFPLDFNGWENETFCNNHVCHGSEMPYVFQSASVWVNFTDAGRRVASSIGTYWTNFAKSQNPNQPIAPPVPWPTANTNRSYLYFQDPLDIRQDYLGKVCDFWENMGYNHTSYKL